jgi:type VI secretion system secreted protein Hcp
MATNYFLLVDGIDGGSTDEAHQGWFEIDGYGFEVASQSSGPTGGGGGAGRVEFSPLTVTLSLEEGLTDLLANAATGRHLRGIEIEGVTTGEAPQTTYELTLDDVTVAAVQDGGGTDDLLVFDYARIGIVTHAQQPDGSTVVSGSFGFDRTTNAVIAPPSLPDLSPGTGGVVPVLAASQVDLFFA